MKKRVNFNFFSVLSIVIAFVLAALVLVGVLFPLEKGIDKLESDMSDTYNSSDEIGDAEGWGLIIEGFGYVLLMVVLVVGWVMVVFFGLMALIIFVPLLIARLLYRPSGGRLLAYRILMGVVYGLLILWTVGGFIMLCGAIADVANLEVWYSVGSILMITYNTAVIVFGIRNTYTKRICEQEQNFIE